MQQQVPFWNACNRELLEMSKVCEANKTVFKLKKNKKKILMATRKSNKTVEEEEEEEEDFACRRRAETIQRTDTILCRAPSNSENAWLKLLSSLKELVFLQGSRKPTQNTSVATNC
jgi:Na+-translocating ferredoxin:NAD+ oxidoreductase RnfC subunit